jgi:phage tail-like protein
VAKYGVNYYGSSSYGSFVNLRFSVQPMSVLATELETVSSFAKVLVRWQTPRGNFTRIRLVRNQAGFPETAEDGVIIYDEFATEGTVSRTSIIDGEENPTDIPLVPGRQVYYRMFLFTETLVWKVAGSITAIVPSDHGIQDRFMATLPRVFTSKSQESLGAVDADSDLYKFVSGLTFAQEELYTLIDLLKPRHTGLETPFELIPAEVTNYGLLSESALPIKNQKRLIREALYMYTTKGTENGLERYAESLTGYAPTITVSENLLLTVQDSTFYGGIGNWVASSAVLTSSTEQVPDSNTNQIDTTKTGKIVASGSGSMVLGATNIITKGVPVLPSTEYTVSCKLKSPASAGNITLSVRFYDKDGTATSAANTATAVAANNTWKSASKTATSDATSSYAIITIAYSAAGTYYIDQVCMQTGAAVAYDEARAIDVFLLPSKTNYIKNPSFEVNSTTWALSGATFTQDSSVPTYGYSGDYSGKFVVTNPWSITTNYEIPITTGKYYTVSASIKALAALSANLKITFYDDSDAVVETVTEVISVTTSFANFTLTGLTDSSSNASYAKVSFYGTTAGTLYLDLIQFEQSQIATDYFDGSLPSEFGAVWEGTDDASYTHLYPNKPKKVPRLGKTINDWVPQNAFWRVRTYDGVEYTTTTV